MKFKIGDKVKCNDEFTKAYGKIGVIIAINEHFNTITYLVQYDEYVGGISIFGKRGYTWWSDEIDLEKIENKKIIITTDGKTVTAKEYNGKTVINTATAKCHPDDEFNFDIGAKIAFERLIKTDFKENGKFNIGDKVKIINDGELYTTYPQWVEKYAKEYSVYYAYGSNISEASLKYTYKIIAKGKHENGHMLYLIRALSACYLISEYGLILAKD